jgi:acyl-CoA synthetase (AMP-forming)/AMP-acid ligase II
MTETLMNMSNRMPASAVPARSARCCRVYRRAFSIPEGASVPDGETGEVHLRGPNVFRILEAAGRQPRGVRRRYRTGDLAVRSPTATEPRGGGKSDLIISGGFNIYLREIEELLLEQE